MTEIGVNDVGGDIAHRRRPLVLFTLLEERHSLYCLLLKSKLDMVILLILQATLC
jgi:hypothetical protein